MSIIRWGIIAPVAAIIAVFSAVNRGPVTVNLWPLPFLYELPLCWLILALFILGYGLASLKSYFHKLKIKLKLRKAQQQIDVLETRLSHLNAPLPRVEGLAEHTNAAQSEGGKSSPF